ACSGRASLAVLPPFLIPWGAGDSSPALCYRFGREFTHSFSKLAGIETLPTTRSPFARPLLLPRRVEADQRFRAPEMRVEVRWTMTAAAVGRLRATVA